MTGNNNFVGKKRVHFHELANFKAVIMPTNKFPNSIQRRRFVSNGARKSAASNHYSSQIFDGFCGSVAINTQAFVTREIRFFYQRAKNYSGIKKKQGYFDRYIYLGKCQHFPLIWYFKTRQDQLKSLYIIKVLGVLYY